MDAQGPAKPEAPAQCSVDEQKADETQHGGEQGQDVKQGGWWSRWSVRKAAAAPTGIADVDPKASSLKADQPAPSAKSTEVGVVSASMVQSSYSVMPMFAVLSTCGWRTGPDLLTPGPLSCSYPAGDRRL